MYFCQLSMLQFWLWVQLELNWIYWLKWDTAETGKHGSYQECKDKNKKSSIPWIEFCRYFYDLTLLAVSVHVCTYIDKKVVPAFECSSKINREMGYFSLALWKSEIVNLGFLWSYLKWADPFRVWCILLHHILMGLFLKHLISGTRAPMYSHTYTL